MSDVATCAMIGAYVLVAIVLAADEIRYRYCQPKWTCSKCGHGPLEANGPASILDQRRGFVCPKCAHVMEAHRSMIALVTIGLMSLAITIGCGVIVALDLNPDLLGLTREREPVMWLVYVGLVAGPIGAALSAYLMFRPTPKAMSS